METELQELFFAPVTAFAAANNLGVSWPNGDNSLVTDGPYIEVSFDPLDPDTFGICDGASIYEWLVLFNVNVRDGVGGLSPTRYVDKLREAFPVLYKFTGVVQSYQIIKPVSVKSGISKPGWFFVPVQFRIRSIK